MGGNWVAVGSVRVPARVLVNTQARCARGVQFSVREAVAVGGCVVWPLQQPICLSRIASVCF